MRIEEGKFYRTRDGRKVGPMSRCGVGSWPWGVDGDCEHWDDYCREDGTTYIGGRIERPNDLISEWIESPIRTETVTVRRLEPGVYGRLIVTDDASDGNGVGLKFASRLGGELGSLGAALSAPELRELARVALEIAEYLDAQ